MLFIEKLLRLAGKNNFQIDENISYKYLMGQCWKYGWMMVRGWLFAFGNNQVAKNVFIGSHVKVRERKNLRIGEKTKLHEDVYIDALSVEGVNIGNNVVLGRRTRIETTGSLQSIGKGLKIGNNSTFGSDCYFGAAGGIEIGDDIVAGQYIRFHSENHNYYDRSLPIREQGVKRQGIKVGNNCWIGAGAVFLDGSEIGNGCVVAANAVVTKAFSDNVVIAGVPAKIIRYR